MAGLHGSKKWKHLHGGAYGEAGSAGSVSSVHGTHSASAPEQCTGQVLSACCHLPLVFEADGKLNTTCTVSWQAAGHEFDITASMIVKLEAPLTVCTHVANYSV